MDFEFDPAKNVANIAKHGLPLSVGVLVIENAIREFRDIDHGEDRWIAYGFVDGNLLVCVYTLRGATHRIISVRGGDSKERRRWPRQ